MWVFVIGDNASHGLVANGHTIAAGASHLRKCYDVVVSLERHLAPDIEQLFQKLRTTIHKIALREHCSL